MTTLLILTPGNSDVQIVMNGRRHPIDIKRCGRIHTAIAKRSWTVVDAPADKGHHIGCSDDLDDSIELCTPRVDSLMNLCVDRLKNEVEANDLRVAIIGTERTEKKDDPHQAITFIKSRLKSKFGLNDDHVRIHVYLRASEKLECQRNATDRVIRRGITGGIASFLAEILQMEVPSKVYVTTTGGIRVVGELVEEIVRLHARSGASVQRLKTSDGSGEEVPTVDQTFELSWSHEPAESYRARRRALELIEGGNLLGAWGAVQHLHQDEAERCWTSVIEWLAMFASSRPMPESWNRDFPVLTDKPMAVRAALRVELALRAGDIPRAIHGTVAFAEAALWDWLRERNFEAEDGASGNLADGFTFTTKPSGKKKERFWRPKGEEKWRIKHFKEGVDPWLAVLNKPMLKALWAALTDDIRSLRNDVAHNEPTTELMVGAKKTMRDAELWSNADRFLSQELVKNVLIELRVDHPESLLDNLLEAVRERLRHVPQLTEAESQDGSEA